MRKRDLEKFRPRLFEMRAELIHEVQRIEEAIQEDLQTPGDISHLPTHNADSDAEGIDAQIALAQNEEGILEAVEEALERFEAGTFGQCEQCHQPISDERLEAIPYSPYCIQCAQQLEQRT